MENREIFEYFIHKIKNSTQTILLNAQILKKVVERKNIPREKMKKMVDKLCQQSEKLYREVRDTGFYFREENVMEKFDFHCLINDIIEDFQGFIAKRSLHIKTEYDLMVGKIDQDKLKVATVLENILKNSIEASYNNDDIIFSTKKVGEFIMVKIINFGPNISKEIRKKIFKPMITTKSSGSGFGLAISKRFIDDIKGEIKVNSSDQQTEFIITFPIDLEGYEKIIDSRR